MDQTAHPDTAHQREGVDAGTDEARMLSVVIPVWNEDPRNLRALQARLQRTLDQDGQPWEVLFVDDASDTETKRTLQNLAASHSQIRLFTMEQRQGQEAALLTGFASVKGAYVCHMDCDLQHRPEEIPRLLQPLREGYALSLGTRRPFLGSSWRGRLVSRAYSVAMNVRWNVRISDWGCGFNAFRRTVLSRVSDRVMEGVNEPLKLSFIREAVRWIEVRVSQDPRCYGRSGYRGLYFCRYAMRMLSRGTSFTRGRPGQPVDRSPRRPLGPQDQERRDDMAGRVACRAADHPHGRDPGSLDIISRETVSERGG